MQRIVDHALAVTKESVKTLTFEFLNSFARFINGVSALLLTLIPGKANVLEGLHGWELRPTLRGPRLPRWMHNGVSSFNQFIHELSVDSDTSSLEYSSEEDSNGMSTPPSSPLSQGSLRAWATLPANYESHWTEWVTSILWLVLIPSRVLLWVLLSLFGRQNSPTSPRTRYKHSSRPYFSKLIPGKGHHVPNRTTDRRRGVIEDLQVNIEIYIETVFGFFHKAAHLLLSPSETFGIFLSCFSSSGHKGNYGYFWDDEVVQTAILGDDDPSLTEERTTTGLYNTDTRTCQDVITELGYPYEAIRVVTSDGYGLLLERIPRRDARKAVFLQHGALDSSMGWVSNGVVGSPAFAAYD
ncbi:unnamed protein product [Microthlaspi erraticum]|uniref:Partial AB-hydrolase lipase domain-containing protein n=1 Tax=Microthlaspi erraticum TaxID=1685480 RepID=A0A6D2IYZ2_9BRAS|nr:unnamed protein product [Microthlaspi erraticum]